MDPNARWHPVLQPPGPTRVSGTTKRPALCSCLALATDLDDSGNGPRAPVPVPITEPAFAPVAGKEAAAVGLGVMGEAVLTLGVGDVNGYDTSPTPDELNFLT